MIHCIGDLPAIQKRSAVIAVTESSFSSAIITSEMPSFYGGKIVIIVSLGLTFTSKSKFAKLTDNR